MKALLSILITLVAATCALAGENTAPPQPVAAAVQGEVLEALDAGGFTYLRLRTKEGEAWAAVGKVHVEKGAKVTIENVTVMHHFESRLLKRTFPTIAFGNVVGAGAGAQAGGNAVARAHSGNAKMPDAVDVHVPRASGANARTVAEIHTKAAELKDKPVLVRGKVVKYNPGIMGKNWIHLRDGSGSPADNTNDILVTTLSEAKVGDIVTVKGIVRTDKDFGSGYSYKVLIEEATFQQ